MPLQWISHSGAGLPVAPATYIHYRQANESSYELGAARNPVSANSISWRWPSRTGRPSATSIIAYAIADGRPSAWREHIADGRPADVSDSTLVQVCLYSENADRAMLAASPRRTTFIPAHMIDWTTNPTPARRVRYFRTYIHQLAAEPPREYTAEEKATLEALPDWGRREYEKLLLGHFKPVPWHAESWAKHPATDPRALHFPHLSTTIAGCITYCQPPRPDAKQPIRIPIKPGKYLQKFYGDSLTADLIKNFAAKVRSHNTNLLFTNDPAKITAIYQSVGQACMSHSTSHYRAANFNGAKHPTTVYATSPDLALAYTTNPENADAITARAIVWPDRKLYARAYGDTEAMIEALHSSGFRSAPLDGARLPLLPLSKKDFGEGFYTCPYIDHIKWARLDAAAGYLILQEAATGATHSVQHGDGVAYPIAHAPKRPVHNYPGTIAQEHAHYLAIESGKPAPTPTPTADAITARPRANRLFYSTRITPSPPAPAEPQGQPQPQYGGEGAETFGQADAANTDGWVLGAQSYGRTAQSYQNALNAIARAPDGPSPDAQPRYLTYAEAAERVRQCRAASAALAADYEQTIADIIGANNEP